MKIIENYYDIVILPPSPAWEYCIELSERIRKYYDSKLVLGEKHNLPHISLLHTAIPERNLKLLKKRLSFIAQKARPFKVYIGKLLAYPEFGSLALEILPKDAFVPLHEAVISATKDIIDYSFDYRAAWGSRTLPKKMRKYIEDYTTPGVKEYFVPHITLGYLEDKEKVLEVAKTVKAKSQEFMLERITVCGLGENHTCQTILFSISL
jgi:2'-5' RNA ligase